jgi:hypothetical protein
MWDRTTIHLVIAGHGLLDEVFGLSLGDGRPAIPAISSHDAAKESNLPSEGLPRPAGFEDRMGHQARAAPLVILRA